ncbi:MAG: hypothetical protein R3C49_25410 [Planctomycetaceae bacterium]
MSDSVAVHRTRSTVSIPGITAILLVGMAGCIDSKQPLCDPREALIDAELHGTWIWKDSGVQNDEWTIRPAGTGFPKGVLRVDIVEDGKPQSLLCFATKIQDDRYLNIVNTQDDAVPKAWDPKLVTSYTLVRYAVRDSTLIITMLNSDFLTSSIRSGKIAGANSKDGNRMELTATPEELRAFFSQHRADVVSGDTESATRKAAPRTQ